MPTPNKSISNYEILKKYLIHFPLMEQEYFKLKIQQLDSNHIKDGKVLERQKLENQLEKLAAQLLENIPKQEKKQFLLDIKEIKNRYKSAANVPVNADFNNPKQEKSSLIRSFFSRIYKASVSLLTNLYGLLKQVANKIYGFFIKKQTNTPTLKVSLDSSDIMNAAGNVEPSFSETQDYKNDGAGIKDVIRDKFLLRNADGTEPEFVVKLPGIGKDVSFKLGQTDAIRDEITQAFADKRAKAKNLFKDGSKELETELKAIKELNDETDRQFKTAVSTALYYFYSEDLKATNRINLLANEPNNEESNLNSLPFLDFAKDFQKYYSIPKTTENQFGLRGLNIIHQGLEAFIMTAIGQNFEFNQVDKKKIQRCEIIPELNTDTQYILTKVKNQQEVNFEVDLEIKGIHVSAIEPDKNDVVDLYAKVGGKIIKHDPKRFYDLKTNSPQIMDAVGRIKFHGSLSLNAGTYYYQERAEIEIAEQTDPTFSIRHNPAIKYLSIFKEDDRLTFSKDKYLGYLQSNLENLKQNISNIRNSKANFGSLKKELIGKIALLQKDLAALKLQRDIGLSIDMYQKILNELAQLCLATKDLKAIDSNALTKQFLNNIDKLARATPQDLENIMQASLNLEDTERRDVDDSPLTTPTRVPSSTLRNRFSGSSLNLHKRYNVGPLNHSDADQGESLIVQAEPLRNKHDQPITSKPVILSKAPNPSGNLPRSKALALHDNAPELKGSNNKDLENSQLIEQIKAKLTSKYELRPIEEDLAPISHKVSSEKITYGVYKKSADVEPLIVIQPDRYTVFPLSKQAKSRVTSNEQLEVLAKIVPDCCKVRGGNQHDLEALLKEYSKPENFGKSLLLNRDTIKTLCTLPQYQNDPSIKKFLEGDKPSLSFSKGDFKHQAKRPAPR